MGERTKIAWCDSTINFWEGCTKVSAGCANCYAEDRDKRWHKGAHWGKGAPRRLSENAFKTAFRLNRKPWVCTLCHESWSESDCDDGFCPNCFESSAAVRRRRIFSLSLGDWLDPEVPLNWLGRMLDIVAACRDCDWLLCTKRPELWHDRLTLIADTFPLPEHSHEMVVSWLDGTPPKQVWVLTTAENQEMADKRILELLQIPAVVRGLSCEPLLGPIDLDLKTFCVENGEIHLRCEWARRKHLPNPISWVIVGGESGKNARPCNVEWIRSIKNQCKSAGVSCFVKQFGAHIVDAESARTIKHPKGTDPSEWPEDLRVQQFPED